MGGRQIKKLVWSGEILASGGILWRWICMDGVLVYIVSSWNQGSHHDAHSIFVVSFLIIKGVEKVVNMIHIENIVI